MKRQHAVKKLEFSHFLQLLVLLKMGGSMTLEELAGRHGYSQCRTEAAGSRHYPSGWLAAKMRPSSFHPALAKNPPECSIGKKPTLEKKQNWQ